MNPTTIKEFSSKQMNSLQQENYQKLEDNYDD